MTLPDLINGSFELAGGAMQCLNIRQLMRDKKVRGVNWSVTAFFAAWGLWNCYFYPHLDQWASFTGGITVTTTNLIWVALAVHYSRLEAELRRTLQKNEQKWAKLAADARAYHDSLRTPAGQPLSSTEAMRRSQEASVPSAWHTPPQDH